MPSQSLTAVSFRLNWVGLRVMSGMKVTKEMNVHASKVFGTSRAAMIVAYFAVPGETTPTRCLNRKGRSFANILDTQSAIQTISTHTNIHTRRTPYR